MTAERVVFALIVALALLCGLASVVMYRRAADGCTGIVVRDYMGFPKCVQSALPVIDARPKR